MYRSAQATGLICLFYQASLAFGKDPTIGIAILYCLVLCLSVLARGKPLLHLLTQGEGVQWPVGSPVSAQTQPASLTSTYSALQRGYLASQGLRGEEGRVQLQHRVDGVVDLLSHHHGHHSLACCGWWCAGNRGAGAGGQLGLQGSTFGYEPHAAALSLPGCLPSAWLVPELDLQPTLLEWPCLPALLTCLRCRQRPTAAIVRTPTEPPLLHGASY